MLRKRAIQIGLAGGLSAAYAANPISIQDVTELARRVGVAHGYKKEAERKEAMALLSPDLPLERAYLPLCSDTDLTRLGMLPGLAAERISAIGRGKAPGHVVKGRREKRGKRERSKGQGKGGKKKGKEEE